MYPRLEEKMKEFDWKTRDLAVCMRVSEDRAANCRTGRTPFRELEKCVLAKAFKVREDELFQKGE